MIQKKKRKKQYIIYGKISLNIQRHSLWQIKINCLKFMVISSNYNDKINGNVTKYVYSATGQMQHHLQTPAASANPMGYYWISVPYTI